MTKKDVLKFWYVKVISPCPYTETVHIVSSLLQSLDRIVISYAQAKLCVKIKPSGPSYCFTAAWNPLIEVIRN